MPEKEFEIYLSVLSQLLRLSPAQKAAISDEFRDHMEERLTTLLQSGMSREQAIQKAMEEFGDVTGLALDLTRVSRTPLRKVVIRSTIAASAAAVVIVVWVTLFVPEHRVAAPLAAQAQQAKPANNKREEPAPQPKQYPVFPIPTARVAKILQALDASTSMDFQNKPLEEALAEIETQHGIGIWINKQAMQDASLNTESRVTLTLKDIPLRSCLKLLLQPLGFIYVIEDEVMKITPAVCASDTENATRIYPAGDLFDTAEEATQLLKTIECGLREFGTSNDNNVRNLAVSSRMKTLTVRKPFVAQEQVQTLLRALREAQVGTDRPRANQIVTYRGEPQRAMRSFPLPSLCEARILQAYEAPTTAKWDDTTLAKVMDDLERLHQIEIWFDAKALESEGNDDDTKVTLTCDAMPLRECLLLLLEPLALASVVEDDVLKITTISKLNRTIETRIYPVGDLFATADEANQFLETIECGLEKPRNSSFLAVSSRMKTLTVRDTYVGQEKARQLLCALRDALQASVGPKLDRPSDGGNLKTNE